MLAKLPFYPVETNFNCLAHLLGAILGIRAREKFVGAEGKVRFGTCIQHTFHAWRWWYGALPPECHSRQWWQKISK